MSKLLNEVVFKRQIQRIVETKKGLIINGAYYRKDTMTPVPFSFFPTYGSCFDMSINQRALIGTGRRFKLKNRGNLIVTDTNDQEIQYLFLTNARDENTQNILKIRENDNECKCIYNSILNATPTDYSIVYQVVGQDATYVYILFDSSGLCEYLYRMNKNTLGMERIRSFTQYTYVQGLYETENYIYLASSYKGKNTISKYNKVDNSIVDYNSTLNETATTNISFEFTEPIKSNEHLIIYGLKSLTLDTNKQIQIIKIDIDLQNTDFSSSITESVVDTVYTDEINSLPVIINYYAHYEPFITQVDGSRYLNIAIYDVYNSTTDDYSKHGIYTFKLNDNNLELKSFLNLGNVPFRGYLTLNDNKTLICLTDNSIFFVNFTLASESYIINDNKVVNPKSVGVDLNENVWYVNGNNTVDLMNVTSADSVEISSENSNYTYTGENISTFINVSAKNISGELIATKLSLTIKGEAVWDSNNTKNINVTTSNTEALKIPITIKNNGNITIIPKFVL